MLAVLYLSVVFIFSFFPASVAVDAENMNWSSLIYGATLVFSIVWFFVRGRKEYAGPVEYVRKDI